MCVWYHEYLDIELGSISGLGGFRKTFVARWTNTNEEEESHELVARYVFKPVFDVLCPWQSVTSHSYGPRGIGGADIPEVFVNSTDLFLKSI